MNEVAHRFDDADAYERFMGAWSRAAGATFLDWLDPPAGARWLDVGCGTGVFTALIAERCAPAVLAGIDPAEAQVDHARRRAMACAADLRVADAAALPFATGSFDLVVSALTINFIADRPSAAAEMRRVARRGGSIAGYVWDFAAERSPSGPLRRAMREIGVEPPAVPGTEAAGRDALTALFADAGLAAIETRTIDVAVSYPSFDDLWRGQTPGYQPTTRAIERLAPERRASLVEAMRAGLPDDGNGRIAFTSCANAIRARVPA